MFLLVFSDIVLGMFMIGYLGKRLYLDSLSFSVGSIALHYISRILSTCQRKVMMVIVVITMVVNEDKRSPERGLKETSSSSLS